MNKNVALSLLTKSIFIACLLFFSWLDCTFAASLSGWQQFSFGMTPGMVSKASNGNAGQSSYNPDQLIYLTQIGIYPADVTFSFFADAPRLYMINVSISNPSLSGICSNTDNDYFLTEMTKKYGHFSKEEQADSEIVYSWSFDNARSINLTESRTTCPDINYSLDTNGPSPNEGL